MINRFISLLLAFTLFIPLSLAQDDEDAPVIYDQGMVFGMYNSNLGWGGALTYLLGESPRQYVFSLELQQIRDAREALTAPFIGDQGKRYVFGKVNNFWNLSPMVGVYFDAIPRGRGNILKMRIGGKIGPAIGVLNPYHIELYKAVPGRPFSPEFVVEPYDPGEHTFGEIVGRASFWSSDFSPTIQLGGSVHLNAMVDFSRTEAVIRGIELGVNADIFFQEVPILAEINGVQNRRAFISVSAGLVFGGKW